MFGMDVCKQHSDNQKGLMLEIDWMMRIYRSIYQIIVICNTPQEDVNSQNREKDTKNIQHYISKIHMVLSSVMSQVKHSQEVARRC